MPRYVFDDEAPAGQRYVFEDETKPASSMSRLSKVAQGMIDPINGGAQLLTKMLPNSVTQAGNSFNNWLADKTGLVGRLPEGGVDQQVREQEAAYQAKRRAGGEAGFDGYRMIGNIASPANLAVAAGLPNAASLAGRVAVGASGGAAVDAMAPVTQGGDYWSDKAKQVAIGAASGGALPLAAAGLGRIVSPRASLDPNVALLRGEGVQPTVGQTLGGRWNAVEEKMQSIPILGDAITGARGRARDQFNNAAINRATSPIGQRVDGVGQTAVGDAEDAIRAAYTAGKAQLGHFQIDQRGAAELTQLQAMTRNLPQRERRQFDAALGYLQNEVSPNGSILPDAFKRLDSKLGKDAANFNASPDAYQKQTGAALAELQRIVNENAQRANPQAAAMIKQADEAYANLVRVQAAAKAAKNTEGVFSPAQLNMAVQSSDRSVRGRAVARGDALMQDLGNAGQQVLGNQVPDSGTAGRMLLAGGGLGAGFLNPAIPLGLLGGASMYSSPVQGLLRAAVSSRPQSAQAVRGALNQASPMFSPSLGLLGLEMTE